MGMITGLLLDKLQKQVDFLEKNDDFAIVFHMVGTVDELDGAKEGRIWPKHPKEVYTIEDLLKECFIHTAAIVCRNGLFGDFPNGSIQRSCMTGRRTY